MLNTSFKSWKEIPKSSHQPADCLQCFRLRNPLLVLPSALPIPLHPLTSPYNGLLCGNTPIVIGFIVILFSSVFALRDCYCFKLVWFTCGYVSSKRHNSFHILKSSIRVYKLVLESDWYLNAWSVLQMKHSA